MTGSIAPGGAPSSSTATASAGGAAGNYIQNKWTAMWQNNAANYLTGGRLNFDQINAATKYTTGTDLKKDVTLDVAKNNFNKATDAAKQAANQIEVRLPM